MSFLLSGLIIGGYVTNWMMVVREKTCTWFKTQMGAQAVCTANDFPDSDMFVNPVPNLHDTRSHQVVCLSLLRVG